MKRFISPTHDRSDYVTSSDDGSSDTEQYRRQASALVKSSSMTRQASRTSARRRASSDDRTSGLMALKALKKSKRQASAAKKTKHIKSKHSMHSFVDASDDSSSRSSNNSSNSESDSDYDNRDRGATRKATKKATQKASRKGTRDGIVAAMMERKSNEKINYRHNTTNHSSSSSSSSSSSEDESNRTTRRNRPRRPSRRGTRLQTWESKYSMSGDEAEGQENHSEDGKDSNPKNQDSSDTDSDSPTLRRYNTDRPLANTAPTPANVPVGESSSESSDSNVSSDDSDTVRRRHQTSRRRNRNRRNNTTSSSSSSSSSSTSTHRRKSRRSRHRKHRRRESRRQHRRKSSSAEEVAGQGNSLFASSMLAFLPAVPTVPMAETVVALPIPNNHPILQAEDAASASPPPVAHESAFAELIQTLQDNEWMNSFSPTLTLRTVLDEMHDYICQALESTGHCGVTKQEQLVLLQLFQNFSKQSNIWSTKVQHDVDDLLDAMSLPSKLNQALMQLGGHASGTGGNGSTLQTTSVNQRNQSIIQNRLRGMVNDVPPQIGERITACLTRLNWTQSYPGTVVGLPFQDGRQDCFAVRFDEVGGLRNDVVLHEMIVLPGQRLESRRASMRAASIRNNSLVRTNSLLSRGEENNQEDTTAKTNPGEHPFGEVCFSDVDFHYRGWVYKQTKSKGWALRWFVLTPNGTFISCKSDKAKHAKGSRQVRLVARNWVCTVKEGKIIKGHKNIMTIVHSNTKSKTRGFVLSTLSGTSKVDWMNAVKNYIPVNTK